jgi:hypothetical protein
VNFDQHRALAGEFCRRRMKAAIIAVEALPTDQLRFAKASVFTALSLMVNGRVCRN